MKSVFKVCGMHTLQDVSNIRNAISNKEGVIACQITREKGEVNVVYDRSFICEEDIIVSIEDSGYSVL